MGLTNFDEVGLTGGYLFSGITKERMGVGTIATTGVTESLFVAKYPGVLASVSLVAVNALAASDTNFVALTIQNKGSGASNVAMLAASNANSSRSTGGAAIVAYTPRALTIHATPANLVVAAGDVIALQATVTGTLVNTVLGPAFVLTFTPS